ncbi:hypothetical protein [Georgenia ruanii]|uniref:hypothetical protein n=1 Tax=Georgenia ruanii TaxID=348442 RepID=UPI0012640A91|nr:hypothetical protein [Georgenia ruanii]
MSARRGGATVRARRLRDLVVVVGLVLAPWCWVVANTAYMVAIRDGGSDEDGAASLALAAEYPGLMRVAAVAVILGGILVVPAVAGFYRLAGDRLAVVIGGGLMAAGYICYGGVGPTTLLQIAMAEHGGPVADFAAAIDAGMADPWGMWPFLLFVLGNLGGTLVLAIGLWRGRVAPTWVPVALMCWPLLHVLGLIFMRNEVPQVVGAIIQAAGFAACARLVHRAGRDARPGPSRQLAAQAPTVAGPAV